MTNDEALDHAKNVWGWQGKPKDWQVAFLSGYFEAVKIKREPVAWLRKDGAKCYTEMDRLAYIEEGGPLNMSIVEDYPTPLYEKD